MEILNDDRYNYDNKYSEDESRIYDKINKQYLKSLAFEELINQDIEIKTIHGRFEEIKTDEPVDIIKHKDNFDHFCNFIIFENGEIYYALPSHILFMIMGLLKLCIVSLMMLHSALGGNWSRLMVI